MKLGHKTTKMNSKPKSQKPQDVETDNTLSIDEFFRQLEAKEKDLDISSELVIEFGEPDEQPVPDFVQADLPSIEIESVYQSAHHAAKETAADPIQILNLQTENAELQKQVARMETERVELIEGVRRRQNDFENYKNRTERERGETFRAQISNLAMQMLPVVDNLNRALDSTEVKADEKHAGFEQFYEGIVLVSQQLNEILAEMGVSPIAAVGEAFDPHFHEAFAAEENNELPPNTVTEEILRGYQIGERVIRPSMVKVSK